MKTTIIYNNVSFIEQDNTNIQLTNFTCSCVNKLIGIPLATVVLGLVESCNHCGKSFPSDNHCAALVESYKGLIEGEELVSLD